LTLSEQKRKLRSELKERLQNLHYSYSDSSLAVYSALCKTLKLEEAKVIATYIDFNKELPTLPFLPKLFGELTNANDARRVIAVPFCEGRDMKFYRLRPPQLNADQGSFFPDLSPGKYGILEPLKELRGDLQNIVSPESIEIMLTPGLGFDLNGRRLGRGAGYYDRYLPQTSKNMLIIALAFDCQIVKEVPTEEFDITVDAIVTPTRFFPISEKFKTSELTIRKNSSKQPSI